MDDFTIRKILPDDNSVVANIIRSVMTEFGAVGSGFSIEDPEVDTMYESYQMDRAEFYVVASGSRVLGVGGIAPLAGGESDTCELKKMYFLAETRGRGLGRRMVELLIDRARHHGYRQIYIETLRRMEAANHLYRKLGFQPLPANLGATGHCGCDLFYAMDLDGIANRRG
jgi:putative acetyltransferase